MKIAIASEGKDINAMISSVSGKAPYFLIFEDNKLVEVIENKYRFGGSSGINVAEMLASKGIDVFVGTRIGANFKIRLESRGIKTIEVPIKSVKEILEEWQEQ